MIFEDFQKQHFNHLFCWGRNWQNCGRGLGIHQLVGRAILPGDCESPSIRRYKPLPGAKWKERRNGISPYFISFWGQIIPHTESTQLLPKNPGNCSSPPQSYNSVSLTNYSPQDYIGGGESCTINVYYMCFKCLVWNCPVVVFFRNVSLPWFPKYICHILGLCIFAPVLRVCWVEWGGFGSFRFKPSP